MISEKKASSKEIIESGLGSIGKIKILKALAEEDRMTTVYMLHKRTHLKREDIKRNLDELLKIGWVKETRLANAMFVLNKENNYVARLISFFNEVGYIDDQS